MNGAQAMIHTLVDAGVTTCFTNPGTSEMHFVAALDSVPEMRGVLALFEGVATGAADGYARMTGGPACTLLHLGPGLGNGLANLHNARRAASPMVNIVGDHATYHERYDAPLASDIRTVARNVSPWIGRPERTEDLCRATTDAIAAATAPPGQVATLILPADVSWSDGATPLAPVARPARATVESETVEQVVKVLRSGEPTALLLGGSAMRRDAQAAAFRIAAGTGARLFGETFVARTERGAGIPAIERIGYFAEMAEQQLAGLRHLVLVDAVSPVTFFAYPGRPSDLVPEGCQVHVLSTGRDDADGALAAVAALVGLDATVGAAPVPGRPTGALTGASLAAAIAATMPERAIVCDESNTNSGNITAATAGCAPHDWLQLTGGAIGVGLPLATGAAVACPDRPVLALEADGSAMYTIQSLWTQARESLDVTTVIMNNRSYAILNIELARTGAGAGGPKARDLLDLSRPDLDFVKLAEGMGVPAVAVRTAEDAAAAIERAIAEPGPHLIEAVLTPR
ncbi:MAG: thiamine pyrophosphate protein domain protein TPP-binding protein [Ilumatobacteraceae bacterium]|nr:thiamine pyrophosphate protein domain protein TPP-binding protein [Ilumatobacteraceae bacterium]